MQQHIIYCRSTPFANTPLSHIYHNTVFTKHFPLKPYQIATTYQHIVPLPFTSYPYLQDPQTCTQIFPYTKVIMARLNRSNDKNTIPNLKPPPPTSTSKGIPPDHHTHTNTPQPTRTKSLAMAQPPSAFTDTVYPITTTTNPSNQFTFATPTEKPPAKSTPNLIPGTDQPIVDMVTPDVLPKSTHLTTNHNTTHTSRTTSNNDFTLTANHDYLRQPTPIKHCHGPKPVPTLKATLECNSNEYTAFMSTYTGGIAEWEPEHLLRYNLFPKPIIFSNAPDARLGGGGGRTSSPLSR